MTPHPGLACCRDEKQNGLSFSLLLVTPVAVHADVALVTDGKPVAEIVVAEDASGSVRTAADELQKHLQAMSGAKLAIVHHPTKEVANQVFVGKGAVPKELGFSLDGVKADGFRIVAENNHLILAGNEFDNFPESTDKFINLPRPQLQPYWEKLIGEKWRWPPINFGGYHKDLESHYHDGTGTLYAVYEFLEQLGLRWYAPIPELGIVTPELKDIKAKSQSITKEPEFPVRNFVDCKVLNSMDEFLWYKAMKVGGDRFVPIYHSFSGPMKLYNTEQPQEYYGKINGKVDYNIPRLSNPLLRDDTVRYLQKVEEHLPGMDYISIGQPDGWSQLDSDDVAAGWDKLEQRGQWGRYSDYAWDFNLDLRDRLMKLFPDKKFTVFAYGITSRIPSNLEKVPDNVTVAFTQTSASWMLPERKQELERRNEWIAHMSSPDQLYIWEYYLQHVTHYNLPPIPVIFPELMKESFAGLYDHSLGFIAEIGWTSSGDPRPPEGYPDLARPWISHIMLYLHNKLCWDRNLDIRATLDEYYTLFYGPAKKEMKEFFEFAESVWMRPLPRQVTATGGFLKQEDVDRYFDLLQRAKEKAGDTVYGKRIDGIRMEMDRLSLLFEKLKRTGPNFQIGVSKEKPLIDGDLNKPFWREQDPERHGFHPLRDMRTGEKPEHVETKVSFRWINDNSALIVGIECMEPKMNNLTETSKVEDSSSIFADDMVEIRLETAAGIRPLIGVNSAGVVFDECSTERLEDLPGFYKVGKVAVKKYPDRWTVEIQIDAKPISGERPTTFYPWGVNINRQRMAGNEPEHYMLSPSGTNFREPTCMANIFVRK